MAASGTRVTVSTTAIALATGSASGTATLVRNRGTSPVYLGGSGVTTATGFQVDAGDIVSIELGPLEIVYAIAAAGSHVCHVLRNGV